MADSDPFGMEDLLDTVEAINHRPYYPVDWGKAIVAAVEQLEDARGKRRVDFALFDTVKNAAEKRYQFITPFEGMLEAPKVVTDVYQRHRDALQGLIETRDDVLDGVLRDLASRVMKGLEGVRWGELARYGAVRHQPPQPAGYEEWDF